MSENFLFLVRLFSVSSLRTLLEFLRRSSELERWREAFPPLGDLERLLCRPERLLLDSSLLPTCVSLLAWLVTAETDSSVLFTDLLIHLLR